MEPEGSSPYSQQHVTCPHPKPDQPTPRPRSFSYARKHQTTIPGNIFKATNQLNSSIFWIITLRKVI